MARSKMRIMSISVRQQMKGEFTPNRSLRRRVSEAPRLQAPYEG
jgi:hypothetical protein